MTGIEITLIIVGLVFMVGSFMVTEKLSTSDISSIAKMSETEVKKIVERQLKGASEQIDSQIDDAIDRSIDNVERALDKETNEKITAISEYSDTVLDNMNKTHNEIMFLYSMLNDKHTELTELSTDVSKMASQIEGQMGNIQNDDMIDGQTTRSESYTEDSIMDSVSDSEEVENSGNHNERILELYKQGYSYIDIARELALGLGEVKLVIDLFKGEE